MNDEQAKQDTRDRIIRVESDVTHIRHTIDGVVDRLDGVVGRLDHHISDETKTMSDVKEVAIRQAGNINALTKLVEQMIPRQAEFDKRMASVELRVYGALLAVTLLWTLLGDKLQKVLGL